MFLNLSTSQQYYYTFRWAVVPQVINASRYSTNPLQRTNTSINIPFLLQTYIQTVSSIFQSCQYFFVEQRLVGQHLVRHSC